MTDLVYFKSDFLPLGSSSISLIWLDKASQADSPWSVLNIKDHGFKTLEAVVSRQHGGIEIYRLSISTGEGGHGFDLGDKNSIPIEKILLDDRYLVAPEGQLIDLSGMDFREFYSRCASLTDHLVTIKFIDDPDIDLAKKIISSVEASDLQEFGDQAKYVESVIIWTRSREQCYLITSNPDHVFERIHESLQGMGCGIMEFNF